MAVRIGVDLVHIPRLRAGILTSARAVNAVFTTGEQAYCSGRAERLAGRWAVKEAVLKALGAGLGDVPLSEIEVIRLDSGQPTLRLHGKAEALAQGAGWLDAAVSISHDGDYAIALVVVSIAPSDPDAEGAEGA